jgi:hypothetical protein
VLAFEVNRLLLCVVNYGLPWGAVLESIRGGWPWFSKPLFRISIFALSCCKLLPCASIVTMNRYFAQGPTSFKEEIAVYEQRPHVRAVHDKLELAGDKPRAWQLFAGMFLEDIKHDGPTGLWLSSTSAVGKTWALAYLEDVYAGRTVHRLSLKEIKKMNNMSDWPENTLVLLDETKKSDYELLKMVCAHARVVVASNTGCPDEPSMRRRFLELDEIAMESIRCFTLA